MAGGGEAVDGAIDLRGIVLCHGLFGLRESRIDLLGFGLADLAAVLFQRLFDVVDHGVGAVAGLDGVVQFAIVGGVRFGVLGHLFHFILGKTGGGSDGDLLFVVGAAILGGHVEDAVGVDIEGDFDLRNAARGRRNVAELEYAQEPVIARHGALALVDLDLDRRLVIGGRRESLALARGDGSVAFDQLGEDTAHGLDAERERSDVEQEHVLDFAAQYATLNGGADGDHFVGIHALVRLAAEQVANQRLDTRHTGLAADHHHFVNLRGGDIGVGHGLLAGAHGALHDILDHLLEAGAGQLHLQVLGAAGVGGDEGQVDFGFEQRGELHLGLLGGFLQTLQGHLVLRKIDAVLAFEFGDDPIDDALVDVVATQVGVAIGGFDFDHALADFEDGDVERAAAEIVHGDGFILLLVETVGQRGGGRFVDDAHDFQAGDLAGILGGLALRVVEVSRDGDDRLGNLLAEIRFGGFLELGEDHGGDFGRRILLAADLDAGVAVVAADHFIRHHLHFFVDFVVAPAHEALDGEDGVLRIGNGLAFGHLADEPLPTFGEGHNRRCGAGSFLIGDDRGLAGFYHGHAGIGGAQVDTDDFSHCKILLKPMRMMACRPESRWSTTEFRVQSLTPLGASLSTRPLLNFSVRLSSLCEADCAIQ